METVEKAAKVALIIPELANLMKLTDEVATGLIVRVQ